MSRDRVVSVVGATILVLALAGVVRFELGQREGYDVAFPVRAQALPGASGALQEGASAPAPLTLALPNVTRLELVLTWADDVGAPDTFQLTLTSPEGVARTAQGDAGRLALAFEGIAVAPPPLVLTGSEASVRERLDGYASRAGEGAWVALVALLDAGDQVAPAGGLTLREDAGNAYALAARALAYEAVVTPR